MDIRQSPQFARFMKDLHWKVVNIDGNFIYLKKFPIIGSFAKIPRPKYSLNIHKLAQSDQLVKSGRIFKLKIAPNIFENDKEYYLCRNNLLSSGLKVDNDPFNPTTTIQIDLSVDEKIIFANFSEAKRRAVRRAQKNNITVSISDDFQSFINIRKKQFSPMGFLVVSEMKALRKNFFPKNAKLLLAFNGKMPLGGILLLFFDQVAYYWYASALREGKKLFAPTLLVWEALKTSKKEGCKVFDFEGIFDPRFPKAGQSWIGFTKFKEGFGGKKKTLIENFTT